MKDIKYEVDVLVGGMPRIGFDGVTRRIEIPGFCSTPCPHKQGVTDGGAGVGSSYCTKICKYNKGTDKVNNTIICGKE